MTLIIILLAVSSAVLYIVQARNLLLGYRDNDGLFHLVCAREMREGGGLINIHRQFYPGKDVLYTYPPILHLLLAFFVRFVPDRILLLWPIALNAIVAAAIASAMFCLGAPSSLAITGALIFLILPCNITQSMSITPRHLGILLHFLSLIIAQFAYTSDSPVLLLVSAFFLALTLLSHRMAAQVAVITAVAAAIFGLTTGPLVLAFGAVFWLFGAVIIALTLSRGFYIRVFKDHVKRLFLHFRFGPQTGKNLRPGNPILIVQMCPFLPLVLGLLITTPVDTWPHTHFLIWLGAAISLFTSIFWLWGSAERHIIFFTAFLPIILMDLHCYQHTHSLLWIFVAITLAVDVHEIRKRYGINLVHRQTIEAFKYVDALPGDRLVMVTPKIASPAFLYFCSKRLFAYPHDAGAMQFNRLAVRWKLNDDAYMANLVIRNGINVILNNKPYDVSRLIRSVGFSRMFENSKCEVYFAAPTAATPFLSKTLERTPCHT